MPTAEGVSLSYAFGLPPEEAIRYFEDKGYAISFKWQDVWAEAHAKAFTVAGVTKLDVLSDIRGALGDALKNGETLAEFQNRLQPLLEAKGWWGKGQIIDTASGEIQGKRLNPRRLETIFRTNLQSSYMAGRYQAQMANAERRPWWEYVAVMDNRTRPAHRSLHGRIFRYDDPFWRRFYPPNGWGCRCRVRSRSARDVERLGLATSSSDGCLSTVDQLIDRTGSTRPATAFTDPATGQRFMADAGFGFNPGRAAYQPELDRYPMDVARQYVQGTLTGPAFKRWYQQADDLVGSARKAMPEAAPGALRDAVAPQILSGQRYPVAILDQAERALLGVETQTVWLSDETLLKQLIKREGQAIGLSDYWRVQDVIEQAQLIVRQGDSNVVFIRRSGRIYHAVIKATQSRQALFLTSFRESNMKAAQQSMQRGEVVRNLLVGE